MVLFVYHHVARRRSRGTKATRMKFVSGVAGLISVGLLGCPPVGYWPSEAWNLQIARLMVVIHAGNPRPSHGRKSETKPLRTGVAWFSPRPSRLWIRSACEVHASSSGCRFSSSCRYGRSHHSEQETKGRGEQLELMNAITPHHFLVLAFLLFGVGFFRRCYSPQRLARSNVSGIDV